MKKVGFCYVAMIAVVVVAVVLAEMQVANAADCNPLALSPCLPAVQNPSINPSDACCGALKAQQPCLCGYLKDPALAPYVNSPGAKRVSAVCGVPTPKCS